VTIVERGAERPECRCGRPLPRPRLLGRHVLEGAAIIPAAVSGVLMVGDRLSATVPMGAAPGPEVTRARPKSSSLAPVLVSMTLPGFKSR
jgi:hypothetical protein